MIELRGRSVCIVMDFIDSDSDCMEGEEEYEDGDSQIEEEELGEGLEEFNFYVVELSDSEELYQILDIRVMLGGSEDYEVSYVLLDYVIVYFIVMWYVFSKGLVRLEKVK